MLVASAAKASPRALSSTDATTPYGPGIGEIESVRQGRPADARDGP
ncbi:hypothetical protein ABZ656_44845 [Streptomyces sp. NPDC007095]